LINDCISLDFLGKRCKNNSHNLCDGQWKGLGFEICCNCECHRKQVLGRDESLSNTVNRLPKRSRDNEL
jgi:hypothetical protein